MASCMWCGVQASCLTDKHGTHRRRPVSHGFHSMCLPKYHILQAIESIDRLKITRWENSTCRVASCRSNDTETSGSGENNAVWTEFVAETLLPTNQGKFRLRGYRHTVDDGRTFTEPSAIMSGAVENREEVVVRVHDACFTSEVLGSLKCDCREQLQLALKYIHDQPPGIVIYLQQEGRGIGLANKIAAYALQEKGLDTVDANRALGLPDDCREYSAVKHILNDLGVKSIILMTNNPRKIQQMESLGIHVSGRLPCIVHPSEFNQGYLQAKEERMSHMLSRDGDDDPNTVEDQRQEEELDGSFCYWNHEGEPSSSGVALDDVKLNTRYKEVKEALVSGTIAKEENRKNTRKQD